MSSVVASNARASCALTAAAIMCAGCGMSLDTAPLAPPKPEMQVGRPISSFKQVSLPDVVGMPPQSQGLVMRSLNVAATPLDIVLLRQGDGAVVLRGYANATVAKGKVSFEYFWDVQGQGAACSGRSQGSEVAPAVGADPWAAVTPPMVDRMTAKGLDLVKPCVGAGAATVTPAPSVAPRPPVAQAPKT